MHKFLRFKEKLSLCFGDVILMESFMKEDRRSRVVDTYKKYASGNLEESDKLLSRGTYINGDGTFVDSGGAFVRSAKDLKIPENIDLESWIEKSGIFFMDPEKFSLVMEEIEKFPFARCGTVSPHTSFPIPDTTNRKIIFLVAMRLVTIKGYSGFVSGTFHSVS